ncbi:hypothetical protein AB0K16_36225 [Nonomuraea jabiensis]|uniref:hypothetical protein n=1 Tax=Nonomuraea jabiensis TaxID=882448 RepID=UPI00342653DB
MSRWWYALAAAALALATAWVIGPTGEKPPVQFARPAPAGAVAAPRGLSRYASPIRYAYTPACDNSSVPCGPWVLVAWNGERGGLPGTDAADSLSLSPDGTRAAYLRASDGAYAVADLRTGAVKALPVRQKDGTVGEMFGAQVPLFSLDGRHLLIQRDHLDKDDAAAAGGPAGHERPALGRRGRRRRADLRSSWRDGVPRRGPRHRGGAATRRTHE